LRNALEDGPERKSDNVESLDARRKMNQ
jgi:hypothetical protein